MTTNQAFARARLAACRRWPHATSAILSMVPVETPGLGTAAVDQFWRCYFCPDFIQKCPPDEAAGVILHEVSHLLLNHAKRAQTLVPKQDQGAFGLWNIATDAAINDTLRRDQVKLPEGAVYPERLPPKGQPGNQTAEFYYHKLKEQQREQKGQQGKDGKRGQPVRGTGQGSGSSGQGQADGADGEPASTDGIVVQSQAPGTSGSCSDGQQRPWEHGPPVSEEEAAAQEAEGKAPPPPGLQAHEQDQLRQQVAESLKQAGRGTSSLWAGFVENILNPQVDPRVLLMRAVRRAVEHVTGGSDDWTYRRPARRPGIGGMLRPSPVQIVPRITVIVDSSGSMGHDDLGLAVGLIAKVLSSLRLRDGVNVIVGDTDVQTAGKVFDPKKVAIVGRGGTEMDRLIEHAAQQKPQPDVILTATDGYTDWPRRPVCPHVVACLTQKSQQSSVPSWIQTVVMSRE